MHSSLRIHISAAETKRSFGQLQNTHPRQFHANLDIQIETQYASKNGLRKFILIKQNFFSGTLFKEIGVPVVGWRHAPHAQRSYVRFRTERSVVRTYA